MATIRKRGNSYQIRVSTGYDANGNQVVRTTSWKPAPNMTNRQIEKELQKQALIFEEKCLKGIVATNVKFGEFMERWFKEYAEINFKKTTLYRMRACVMRVYSALGHLKMDKISLRQIQAFINSLAKDGPNLATGKPLAPKTIRHYLGLISDVFNYAVKMGIVSNNPCSKVTIPKGEVREKQIYSQEEMEILLSKMDGEPLKYKAFFYLMAYTGFRRGEMLGLEWKDVDFENSIISVRRTSCYTVDRGVYTDTTKTRTSQRTLKFPKYIMDLLRELHEYQDNEALKWGNKWVETDRLFTKNNGEPQHPNTTYTWLKRFCKRENLPFYGLHSFRHFAASSLISAGLDVTTVSGALGHSNSTTTLNVYSHQFQTAQARVCEAMDRAFGFLKKRHGA